MRVVVTGGSGFIGGHVCRMLGEAGHTVKIVDVASPAPIDLSDVVPGNLDSADSVIHLAARADVRGNWSEAGRLDSRLVTDNVLGTLGLLEACSQVPSIRRFVFVSTGAVYARDMSAYAASKLAGEAWCKAFAAKFGWSLTIVRPAACFGSGYHHGHVADFVKQAKERDGRIVSLTRGLPKDAVHVEDVAGWLVKAATTMPGYLENAYYLRGALSGWGCQDTVRLMGPGVHATWGGGDRGWLGDTDQCGTVPAVLPCKRPIEDGVRDALKSLGWPE